ncbi:MAG: tetratricopeptide repeat protein [Oscillatoria princeps RMCB-10]|jgi:tetratricopeptide (TPR) repeat protein|nr:tetratricopeptide repeat protein [Oscillatoria princeps RMCB-10]
MIDNSDLHISDNRDNLFSFLRSLAKKFSQLTDEKERAFNLLINVWEKTSLDLWEQGYWQDYFRCGKIALKCARTLNHVATEGKLLNELGWALMEREYFTLARQHFNKSLRKFQSIKDADGQCQSLRYLGVLHQRMKLFGSALKYYRRAVTLLATKGREAPSDQRIKWAGHEAELHNLLGNFYLKLWDLPASYRELNLSLKQYRALGEKFCYYQPGPLLNLGRWHFIQGDYDQARRYYQECRLLSKKLHRTDMEAGALLRLAELAEAQGNKEEALSLAQESEEVSGKEITSMRERASQFKYRIKGQNKRSFRRVFHQIRELGLAGLDLLIFAPGTALRAFQHYLTRGFAAKIYRPFKKVLSRRLRLKIHGIAR